MGQQILSNSPVIISNGVKDSSNNTGWTVKLENNLTSEATPTLECHSINGTVMAAVNSWGVPKPPSLGGRTEHPIYQEPASVNPRLNKQTSIITANNQQPASTNNIDDVASWLDSLCSEQQNNQQQQVTELGVLQSRNLVSQQIVSQGLNGTPWIVKSELNGNNGDLMPRGDPLMGSFTTSIMPANNDFDL